MKFFYSMFIFCLTFFSCSDDTGKVTGDRMYAHGFESFENQGLRYFKDNRTNKCFAARGFGQEYSFTCVECDSLVISQIEKDMK